MDGPVTAAAGLGFGVLNTNIVTGTGSHKTGQSGYTGDASAPVVTDQHLRVIRRAPWDTGTGASIGVTDKYPWYEVRIANHVDNYIAATVTG